LHPSFIPQNDVHQLSAEKLTGRDCVVLRAHPGCCSAAACRAAAAGGGSTTAKVRPFLMQMQEKKGGISIFSIESHGNERRASSLPKI